MNIQMSDDRLEELLSLIKRNTSELLKENYTNQQLIQSATSRGIQVLNGSINEQLYVDLCSIALTLLLKNKDIK